MDVPGHPRISKGIFASHSDRAKGVVFMVDSVEFMVQKDQVSKAAVPWPASGCSGIMQYCHSKACAGRGIFVSLSG